MFDNLRFKAYERYKMLPDRIVCTKADEEAYALRYKLKGEVTRKKMRHQRQSLFCMDGTLWLSFTSPNCPICLEFDEERSKI